MRFLSNTEYEAVLLLALKRLGLTETQAKTLIAARWPMPGPSLVGEAEGRGLIVTLQDIQAWLDTVTDGCWADGEPICAENTLFNDDLADKFFAWCVQTGRAKPTLVGHLMENNPVPVKRILQLANSGSN
mgnify:FL=1